jgi:AcrR family transcriptional regulator
VWTLSVDIGSIPGKRKKGYAMTRGISQRRAEALAEGGSAYTEKRAEITAVAAQLFRDKGFSNTSIGDIADTLGMDRSTFYYYVESKEELFHQVVRSAAEENADRAEALRDSDAPASERIGKIISTLMESYATHYPYLFVYIQEDLSKVSDGRSDWSRQMRAINKRYDDAVVAIVQSGFDDGSIRPVASARIIANGIIGMVNWTHRWYRNDESNGPSGEDIGAAYADMVLNGLRTRRRLRGSL